MLNNFNSTYILIVYVLNVQIVQKEVNNGIKSINLYKPYKKIDQMRMLWMLGGNINEHWHSSKIGQY